MKGTFDLTSRCAETIKNPKLDFSILRRDKAQIHFLKNWNLTPVWCSESQNHSNKVLEE